MPSLPRITLPLVVSVLCAVFSMNAIIYLTLFSTDFVLAPITVDRVPEWNKLPRLETHPVVNNVLLILLLIVQHSGMRRGPIKTFFSYLIPENYYRSFYVLTAGICMITMYLFWVPIPRVIWNITNPSLWYLIVSLDLIAWGMLPVSILNLGPLQMLGISEHLSKKAKEYKPTLSRSGFFHLMRHPMYSFLMMGLWIAPKMTVGRLLLVGLYSLYIVYAVVVYEEPALVEEFGPEYVEYMKKTPRFIPNLSRIWFGEQKKD